MKLLISLLLFAATIFSTNGQPVYTFKVKVGVDTVTVNRLGGCHKVWLQTLDMFKKVDRAFNFESPFDAIYRFEVDSSAFYIYEGLSTHEVHKPHPNHDFLVIMDGFKSSTDEQGGGWYGDTIQTIYHARTHNDKFNSPFEQQAIDGIIHEFGHARGMPDIYAMCVNADKNPVNNQSFDGTRCIMNYPYGETFWSKYAVNMINMARDTNVEIDELVAKSLTENITIRAVDSDLKPIKGAKISFYPVSWYSYSVKSISEFTSSTSVKGVLNIKSSKIFPETGDFGLKYCNYLVEAEYQGTKSYAWLPLYEVQNAAFEGKKTYLATIIMKPKCRLRRL